MNYIDFDNLPLGEKAKFVWDNAFFIQSIDYYNARIDLYTLGKQFIEVHYMPATNEIERISFADSNDMNKYVPTIDL